MYLLETHPYNPPVLFVRPTSTMMIAESRHVDKQGRVYLPYLAEWRHVNINAFHFCVCLNNVF